MSSSSLDLFFCILDRFTVVFSIYLEKIQLFWLSTGISVNFIRYYYEDLQPYFISQGARNEQKLKTSAMFKVPNPLQQRRFLLHFLLFAQRVHQAHLRVSRQPKQGGSSDAGGRVKCECVICWRFRFCLRFKPKSGRWSERKLSHRD